LTWQSDSFAYAESYDDAGGRYRGLRSGQVVSLGAEDPGLVVKPDVARRQLDAEIPQPTAPPGETTATGHLVVAEAGGHEYGRTARRFHGTVSLDPARVGRDAGRIAEEVIAHLAGEPGAQVSVTLEIEARLPSGASDQTVRTVSENSRTLKFTSHGFETD
jgi:hypothetical protein